MIAVVTGARRGIGRAIADALENAGWEVLRSAVSSDCPGVKHYLPCDISVAEDRARLCAEAFRRFGRVDLLVNNAGIAPPERLDILSTTPENFRKVLSVNLEGTFFMCQTFANAMRDIRFSDSSYVPRIINLSSVSAYASSVERGEYCISKAGISMTTQLFAHRLAREGIGVFEIRPGIIETDMTAGVHAKYEELIAGGITPIQRFGRPEDIAECVLAISTGAFDFSPGQVFNVDGGYHLRRF
ncbi:MAG: 3-ketoacyl-ACP reductase [Oscillospiraceae bacterium]|jgi:NAD(P)-dependent dehydrogenase (short-subunit alcohol dehydrogenase family)|nr:3-ketoacyl-ACP reductase [Oscillospiraceae bacterium]